jgi:hypothetical protein
LFRLGAEQDLQVAEYAIDGGRGNHDAGVGANDGECEWRRQVLDTGDLEGGAESSSGSTLQVWLVGAVVSGAQLVREEAEELRRRRVQPGEGGEGASPTERRPIWLLGRRGRWFFFRHDCVYGLRLDMKRRIVGRWHCLFEVRR